MHGDAFKALLVGTVRRHRGTMPTIQFSGNVDFTGWAWGEETRPRVKPSIVAEVLTAQLRDEAMQYCNDDEDTLTLQTWLPVSEDGMTITSSLIELLQEVIDDCANDDPDSAAQRLGKLAQLARDLQGRIEVARKAMKELAS